MYPLAVPETTRTLERCLSRLVPLADRRKSSPGFAKSPRTTFAPGFWLILRHFSAARGSALRFRPLRHQILPFFRHRRRSGMMPAPQRITSDKRRLWFLLYPCLPLTREVAFAKQMTEGERNYSAAMTTPPSAFRLTPPLTRGGFSFCGTLTHHQQSSGTRCSSDSFSDTKSTACFNIKLMQSRRCLI